MPISPDEFEIKGSWSMRSGRMTEDDVARRITALVDNELEHIATTRDGWEKLFLDRKDGRLWELNYPHSEMHGGGPRALRMISRQSAQEKYDLASVDR